MDILEYLLKVAPNLAILVGVALVTWIVIKLNDRYGFLNYHGQIHDTADGKTYDFEYDSLRRELHGRVRPTQKIG